MMMVVSPVTSPFPQRESKTTYSVRFFLEAFAVVVVYFAAARLGLSLASINANVSPIWPPSGLAIAAVVLLGFRIWPAILVGAFLANFFTPVSAPVAGAIAIGNTLEALIAVRFLQRFGFQRALDRARDVFVLVASSLVCTTVSATIGSLSVYFGGFAARESLDSLWWTWWLGDSIGALIVAPLLLVWSKDSGAWSSKRYIEAGIVFILISISTIATFSA